MNGSGSGGGWGPRLSRQEIVVLQLRAVGYSTTQIDTLLGTSGEADRLLRSAAARLGVNDVDAAVEIALARGLIVGASGGT